MSNSPCFTLVVKLVIPSSIYWTQENTGTCQLNSSPAVRSLVWAARSQISSKYDRKIVQNMRTTKWAHDATHVSIPQRDNSRVCLNDSEASVFSAIALRKQYSWCIWQTDWAKQSLSSTSYLHSHPILLISHNFFWSSILWHANLVQVCLPWRAGRWMYNVLRKLMQRKKVRIIIKEKNSTVGIRQKDRKRNYCGCPDSLRFWSLALYTRKAGRAETDQSWSELELASQSGQSLRASKALNIWSKSALSLHWP